MSSFLLYIIKSGIALAIFYLLFIFLKRKDTDFAINRVLIISSVLVSMLLPFVQLPQKIQIPVKVELIPEFEENRIQIQKFSAEPLNQLVAIPVAKKVQLQEQKQEQRQKQATSFSVADVVKFVYFFGIFTSVLILCYNLMSVWSIFKKAKVIQMDGHRLLIVDRDLSSFAYRNSIVISSSDYELYRNEILAHELAHIRLKHFYDLMFLELVKTIQWFNPIIYALIRDVKEIHEFQADESVLKGGLNAKQYQLLVIQKGVGHQKFALANSFNYCQIKKRITMMNKPRSQKTTRLKLLAFIPVIGMLLFFFSSCQSPASAKATAEPEVSTSKNSEIQGTWKLVSYNYSGDSIMINYPESASRIKLITENNFCWTDCDVASHLVSSTSGGSYTFVDGNYTEKLEYGSAGMLGYVGHDQKYTVKIENNKLYLSGALSSGQRIREVWEKQIAK